MALYSTANISGARVPPLVMKQLLANFLADLEDARAQEVANVAFACRELCSDRMQEGHVHALLERAFQQHRDLQPKHLQQLVMLMAS